MSDFISCSSLRFFFSLFNSNSSSWIREQKIAHKQLWSAVLDHNWSFFLAPGGPKCANFLRIILGWTAQTGAARRKLRTGTICLWNCKLTDDYGNIGYGVSSKGDTKSNMNMFCLKVKLLKGFFDTVLPTFTTWNRHFFWNRRRPNPVHWGTQATCAWELQGWFAQIISMQLTIFFKLDFIANNKNFTFRIHFFSSKLFSNDKNQNFLFWEVPIIQF